MKNKDKVHLILLAYSAYVPGLPVDERAASPCRFWRGKAGSPGKEKAMQVTHTGKEFKGQPQVKGQ